MLPEVKDSFKLSEIGVGGIAATRELASGLVTLPGGLVVDVFQRHWGLILAAAMGGFGVGWLVMGLSPVYAVLILGMAIVSLTSSIWHLPAMAALSRHFPHRRGMALSLHGVGGNVGDVVASPLTGLLLLYVGWRGILSAYAVAPLLLAFAVFWAFRDIGGSPGETREPVRMRSQIDRAKPLMRNPVLLGIAFVEALREMALVPFDTFLPLYLDEVGMSPLVRGLHVGLLVSIGTVTTPVMGYLSDRVARKRVLIPVLLALSGLTLLLVPFGSGVPLTLIIAALGVFLYSDQPILTAAALDIVGRDVAATTLGVLSFYRFVLSAASPLIAGYLYHTLDSDALFYYVSAILALAVAVLVLLPLEPTAQHAASTGAR
jgi:MFS family permease